MRVVVAGAGSVGRSVARELLGKGHEVALIEQSAGVLSHDSVAGATVVIGDACELPSLEEAGLADADVVVAATGDDKTNLVLSLLAKTEFGVPRTIGRVNNARNEWLFDENWGVDVAVSTPRLMTALVEEAVEVGGLVSLMELQKSSAALLEFTAHTSTPVCGRRIGSLSWPADAVLVAIVRSGRAIAPSVDDVIEVGDELFFLADPGRQDELLAKLRPE